MPRSAVSSPRREMMLATDQVTLPGLDVPAHHVPVAVGRRAIEDESFPFEALSDIAEVESWRKEIYRPTSHIHKWWAQRLGTVFRAITVAALSPSGAPVLDFLYEPIRFPTARVFDPFMGSGTTVIEALKLGAIAVGRDINQVAYSLVRNAVGKHDRALIERTYRQIETDTSSYILSYYEAQLPGRPGSTVPVLYYFWVKVIDCPECRAQVDLFSSYVFAQHAYPKRNPSARALCPNCGAVNTTTYDATRVDCPECLKPYDPQAAPAKGQYATCRCSHKFSIAKTIRLGDTPPRQRLYAKLVLCEDGSKEYLPATDADLALYASAEAALAALPEPFPIVEIQSGHNTNQAIGYNYRYWHQMFNARQLLCLSTLAKRIQRIQDDATRELFTCLFSGTLEFNNVFASYKGEGTGAVRHMFAHHILKPERTPLEANLWGTNKSSGSFSTMFKGRIARALDYAENPFELRLVKGHTKASSEKVDKLSEQIGSSIAANSSELGDKRRVYLSCGDSGVTDLPEKSIDAVISDPPFLDNVHYSELADFFHVWQRHILGATGSRQSNTTRSDGEVQNGDPHAFTLALTKVWTEANRVLRDDGLLVFSYHHSKPEGWASVLEAILRSAFIVSAAHPIKAEMSVAMPKQQAKEPIDLDIILVCRKRGTMKQHDLFSWQQAEDRATAHVGRMRNANRRMSKNDVRIIVMAQALVHLSQLSECEEDVLGVLAKQSGAIEDLIERLHSAA